MFVTNLNILNFILTQILEIKMHQFECLKKELLGQLFLCWINYVKENYTKFLNTPKQQ